MRLFTAAEMRETDRRAIEEAGIPSIELMDRASGLVAEAAVELCRKPTAAVFCSGGNNGGDGVGAAIHLVQDHVSVRVFFVGDKSRITPDTEEMLRRMFSLNLYPEEFDPQSADQAGYVMSCGVIVDALFGTGLKRPLEGAFRKAVELMNLSPAPVVSADVPSGVEADTGAVLGTAVRADVTVTFSGAKAAHYSEPGCLCCGDVRIRSIGIPNDFLPANTSARYAVTGDDIRIPVRERTGHKGTYGKALLLAGSVGYTGAASLAAHACVKSGAGLVFLGVPEDIYAIEAIKNEEAMVFPLPGTDGKLSAKAVKPILEKLKTASACLLGPGLGQGEEVRQVVHAVLQNCPCPLVLDADGINALAGHIHWLNEVSCPVILTPHPGEFDRLSPETKCLDRLTRAERLAAETGCTVILKGHRTVIAGKSGRTFLNTTGNPGMAKGGSGDVLAGMLTALLAQGMNPETAAVAAVYLHGLAGDLAARRYGEVSMTPTDCIGLLGEAFQSNMR